MSIFGQITDVFKRIVGLPTSSQVKAQKAQAQLMTQQMNAYKADIAKMQKEAAAQRAKLAEKQVRLLRRSLRPAGFLDTGSDQGLSATLG